MGKHDAHHDAEIAADVTRTAYTGSKAIAATGGSTLTVLGVLAAQIPDGTVHVVLTYVAAIVGVLVTAAGTYAAENKPKV